MASNTEKPEYVLFYSKDCKYSKNFLAKLKPKPDLIKKFNIVDIDDVPAIPDEIDEVPCVYDGKNVYKGDGAFKWLNEKLVDFLSPAEDGLNYSFLDGAEEQVFNNYSLLEQRNGSYGMGDSPLVGNSSDPTRMTTQNDNSNKNRTMDSLMTARSNDMKDFTK